VLIAVITVAVLLIAAAVGPSFVPTKTYRKAVEEALADKLDARVVIDGFKLRLIPYPSYTIEGFKLVSKHEPFRGMPIVEADKVIGSLSFGALFGGALDTDVEARDVNIFYRSTGGASNVGMMLGLVRDKSRDRGSDEAPSRDHGATPAPAPTVPGDVIQSMPAPAIDTPPEAGGGGRSLHMPDLPFVRNAFAAEDVDDERVAQLGKLAIVRGRIEITTDDTPQPFIIEDVSIAVRDINVRAGFSATFKMTGAMEDATRAAVGLNGSIVADAARGEISFRDVRAYLGGMQAVADGTMGFAPGSRTFNVHMASPNVSQAALDPPLSSLGWMVPAAISWQGTFGVDATFKGTGEAGQLDLQLDATPARFSLGDALTKEAGFPFKLQANVMVRPESYSIVEGALSLQGAEVRLAGDSARMGEMMTRLVMSGAGLSLSAMKTLLPWFPDVDALEAGTAEVEISGSLKGAPGLGVEGKLGAESLSLAGVDLTDVTGTFLRQDNRIEFTTLGGKYGAAKLSGNGALMKEASGSTALEFDVVIGELELKSIEVLKGSAEGSSSMVAKVKGVGADRFALMQSVSLAGSLVASEAKLSGWEAAGGVFSEVTWKTLSEKSGAEIGASEAKALAASGGEVANLNVSFEMTEGDIKADKATWTTKFYAADLSAKVSAAGKTSLFGTIAVDASASSKLVADAHARKKMFDGEGRLILPVRGEGNLGAPALSLDGEALTAMIEARARPRPMVELADEARKEEEKASPKTEAMIGATTKAKVEQGAPAIKAIEAPPIEIEPPVPQTVIGEVPPVEKVDPAEKAAVKEVEEAKKPEVKAEQGDAEKAAAGEPPAAKPLSKPSAPAGASSPPRKPARKRADPAQSNQPVEDILKVIIGD
jgi:hypothetical protein